MSPEGQLWVRHYASGYFSPRHWQERVSELEGWLSPYDKDYLHRDAMLEALRYLLATRPGVQTKLL